MLKIKDNVDLKELEKFEFKKVAWEENRLIHKKFWNFKVNTKENCKDYKRIYITNRCGKAPLVECYDVLFNLIQAGLVEKVD